MRYGGHKEVAIGKIIGPGDLKRRQATDDVKALAISIEKLGGEPQNAIVARKTKRGWEIISGRDRYSALLLIKAKKATIHVVLEATPLELLEAEIEENLKRRDVDRDALVAEMVRRAAKLLPQRSEADKLSGSTHKDNEESRDVTRARTAEGEAREVVAKAMGTTPEAVRAATKRNTAREEAAREVVGNGAGASTAAPAPAPLPIEAHGHPFPAAYQVRVMIVLDALIACDKASQAAQRALTEMESVLTDLKWKPAEAQRLRELAKQLGAAARAARPAHACPYCWDDNEPRVADEPRCKVCGGEGTLTDDQAKNVPPEVWSSDEPEPGDCAHAYRKGAKPTGACLNCGAPGAATWTEAQHVPKGTKAPPHEPNDPGWVAHGPGSDRDVKAAKRGRGPRVVLVGDKGEEREVTDANLGELTVERDPDGDAEIPF